jgi:hypothetical protein
VIAECAWLCVPAWVWYEGLAPVIVAPTRHVLGVLSYLCVVLHSMWLLECGCWGSGAGADADAGGEGVRRQQAVAGE